MVQGNIFFNKAGGEEKGGAGGYIVCYVFRVQECLGCFVFCGNSCGFGT